jgi:hypothetical protein
MKTRPRNLPKATKKATARAQRQLAQVSLALRRIGRKAKARRW